MAAGTRAGRSLAGDAAYGVLAELGFSLPLDVDAVRQYLGLELRRESGLPAGIRGVLDVQERLIVVTDGLPQPAEEYVVLHEGGHYHLPHHRALFYRCSAFDLEVDVRRRLESEANTFATVLRFGGVREGWVEGGEPSITRVRELADMTGASFESALRWLVEHAGRPVWALMCHFRPVRGGAGGGVDVRYGYRSSSARPEPWPGTIDVGHLMPGVHGGGGNVWPKEFSGYQRAGATVWEAYATAYWTCVLLW